MNRPDIPPVGAPYDPILMSVLWELNSRVMLRVCGVGPNGIAPIAPVGVLKNHKRKEPSRALPLGLGIKFMCVGGCALRTRVLLV